MSNFTLKSLLESAVHYGHITRKWNPKMAPYIYGVHNGIHIIDLQKTYTMLNDVLAVLEKVVATSGRVLFVGTKKQAGPIVKEYAELCGQYYVNNRWLGGMLTNWNTVLKSVHKLEHLNEQIESGMEGLKKKEKGKLILDRNKLDMVLGGISKMGGLPSIIVVLDTVKDAICIKEANKLNIPVVAIVDTNASKEGVDYLIPGNDDAIKAIKLYCSLFSQAVASGLKQEILNIEEKAIVEVTSKEKGVEKVEDL